MIAVLRTSERRNAERYNVRCFGGPPRPAPRHPALAERYRPFGNVAGRDTSEETKKMAKRDRVLDALMANQRDRRERNSPFLCDVAFTLGGHRGFVDDCTPVLTHTIQGAYHTRLTTSDLSHSASLPGGKPFHFSRLRPTSMEGTGSLMTTDQISYSYPSAGNALVAPLRLRMSMGGNVYLITTPVTDMQTTDDYQFCGRSEHFVATPTSLSRASRRYDCRPDILVPD
ncbi:hypothetical protein EVAR_25114_1 [Eumeta japonica]|uniref:Uncharacterized protein n=1 Tax=Eumeta variegata TaxID=151549 RepID=A0A4C1XLE3_EUMVA|nr:hypothetical protein EVAR_25114_1 [Eumeta japonica]